MNPTNTELPTAPDSQQMTEGNEYPYPRAASSFQRILAQGKYETLAMLKNGEQLMLNIAFPVLALFGLRYTSFLDSYADALNTTRINVAVPGVLALCVVSTALSGQGIATGFDRRYGVLRFLSTTPLGRNGLIIGKVLAVITVIAIQFIMVTIVGFGLGWRPDIFAMYRSFSTLLLGAAAFTALGLLVAGTVRAEATLAIVNIAWVVLASAGGILIPMDNFPELYRIIILCLPSGALGEAIRGDYLQDIFLPLPHAVLLAWTLVIGFIASRKFKWSD